MTSSVITFLWARPRLKWFYRLATPLPRCVCVFMWKGDYSAAILSGTLISWLAARRYLLTGSRWWRWLDGAWRHPSFWLANNWNPSLFPSVWARRVCACVFFIPSTLSVRVHFRLLFSFIYSALRLFIPPLRLHVELRVLPVTLKRKSLSFFLLLTFCFLFL